MQKTRIPVQNRSIETKSRILEAGMRLFSQKGLHGTNSREIATEANVAIGSFYSYFEDKRDLFIELLKTHRINVMNILNEYSSFGVTDQNQFDLIRRLIKTMWEAHGSTQELDQQADALRKTDPEIDAILKEQEEAGLNRIVSLLKLIEPRLRVKNLEAAAFLIASIARDFFHSAGRSAPQEMDLILDELSDMISRYLFH